MTRAFVVKVLRSPDLRRRAVFVALAVVAAIMWARHLLPRRSGDEGPSESAPANAIAPAPMNGLHAECGVVVTWPIVIERDPFTSELFVAARAETVQARPAAGAIADEAVRVLDVQAIAFIGSSPKLIINGKVRRIDEVIEGFRIVRCEHRSVIVEKDAVQVTVPLRSSRAAESRGRKSR
jgi:hypothetical protein